MSYFQKPGDRHISRSDHIWFFRKPDYKCLLCGAITKAPPASPTPSSFIADTYEALTQAERDLEPYKGNLK